MLIPELLFNLNINNDNYYILIKMELYKLDLIIINIMLNYHKSARKYAKHPHIW